MSQWSQTQWTQTSRWFHKGFSWLQNIWLKSYVYCIKMYDEEITNFYKKGRHWKSKKIGESQLASVGREECWPEISWFSSFHCKSPPPNPPPERLMSIRSQHWHTGKCLATGFPGKWINQTNKNTDLYCLLIIMKQIHYVQFQITNVRSLGADIRRNVHSQYRWCNP